jgi:Tfp pilus assembly protein PilF
MRRGLWGMIKTKRWRGLPLIVKFACMALALAVAAACSSAEVERKQREEKADFHHKLATGYFHAGNVELAIKELIEALRYDEMHAESRYLYGFVLFGRKRYEEAAEHFRRALQSRPGFFAARNHLGVTYLELERWYDAIVALEPLLKEPTYTTQYLVFNNLGWAYFKQGDLRMADKHLRMAVFLNPKLCNGWRNLGLLAMTQRDYRGAVEQFTEATTRCPQYAELHLQRGEALDADRRADEAMEAFKKCAELSGESQLGRRCKAKLGGGAQGWNDAVLHP